MKWHFISFFKVTYFGSNWMVRASFLNEHENVFVIIYYIYYNITHNFSSYS